MAALVTYMDAKGQVMYTRVLPLCLALHVHASHICDAAFSWTDEIARIHMLCAEDFCEESQNLGVYDKVRLGEWLCGMIMLYSVLLFFVLTVSIHIIDCNACRKCSKLVVIQPSTLQGLLSVYSVEIKWGRLHVKHQGEHKCHMVKSHNCALH